MSKTPSRRSDWGTTSGSLLRDDLLVAVVEPERINGADGTGIFQVLGIDTRRLRQKAHDVLLPKLEDLGGRLPQLPDPMQKDGSISTVWRGRGMPG